MAEELEDLRLELGRDSLTVIFHTYDDRIALASCIHGNVPIWLGVPGRVADQVRHDLDQAVLVTVDCQARFGLRTQPQTLVVGDGPAALEAVPMFDPEVLLLDLGLPEMDGCEVARRLRDAYPQRKTLLIAMTGYQRDDGRLETLGFDQHLLKPATLEKVSTLLALWEGSEGPA